MSETSNNAVTETDGEATPPENQTPARKINPTLLGLVRHQMRHGSDYRNIYGANEEFKRGDLSKYIEEAVSGTLVNLSPKDGIEAMLIGQIIVMHNASMECAKDALDYNAYLGRCRYTPDKLELANKCTRSFAMLVETLNRYRGKGQQKVVVEHVHVYPGGQAIVGNVASQGRGAEKIAE